jgi:hypothetical protein
MQCMAVLNLDAVTYLTGNIPAVIMKQPAEPAVNGRDFRAVADSGVAGPIGRVSCLKILGPSMPAATPAAHHPRISACRERSALALVATETATHLLSPFRARNASTSSRRPSSCRDWTSRFGADLTDIQSSTDDSLLLSSIIRLLKSAAGSGWTSRLVRILPMLSLLFSGEAERRIIRFGWSKSLNGVNGKLWKMEGCKL